MENTCTRVSFLIKLSDSTACNFIKKGDSGTGVFLWILRNSSRTSLGGCFSKEKHSMWYWDSHKKYKKTSTCLWIVLPKAINFEIRNSLLSTSYTWYTNVHNHLCWKHETNSAIYLIKVTIETSEKMRNMFKVNSKNTRTTSMKMTKWQLIILFF